MGPLSALKISHYVLGVYCDGQRFQFGEDLEGYDFVGRYNPGMPQKAVDDFMLSRILSCNIILRRV